MSTYNIGNVQGGSHIFGDNHGTFDARTQTVALSDLDARIGRVLDRIESARRDGLLEDERADEAGAALQEIRDEASADQPRATLMTRAVRRVQQLTVGVAAVTDLAEGVEGFLKAIGAT